MIILVCNDDGIRSEGLQVLARSVQSLGEVWVVAPDREQSAASHALTLHRPLRVEQLAPRQFAVEGTLLGIPSLAISLVAREQFDFTAAGAFTAHLVAQLLPQPLPPDALLNV